MKANQDTFVPQVWWPDLAGKDSALLVCARRMVRGKILKEKEDEEMRQYDWFNHPLGIGINPPRIEFNIPDRGLTWRVSKPEEFGLTPRMAKVALREAWRLVDPQKTSFSQITLEAHFHFNLNDSPAFKTTIRNLSAWMNWDEWNRQKLTYDQRRKILKGCGFDLSVRALRRAAEENGIGIGV